MFYDKGTNDHSKNRLYRQQGTLTSTRTSLGSLLHDNSDSIAQTGKEFVEDANAE